MGQYRFMRLSQPSRRHPSLPHVKQLDSIPGKIPEEVAALLDTWTFDQCQDREGDPYEVLSYPQAQTGPLPGPTGLAGPATRE